jgi:hypothetical protein
MELDLFCKMTRLFRERKSLNQNSGTLSLVIELKLQGHAIDVLG